MLHWAEAKGHRSGANPAAIETLRHLLPPATNKTAIKHHAALPWKDVPDLCRELQARHSVSAKALLFAILTAARTGEVIGATWPEIDRQAALWTIPAGRMKGGRAHRVPLPAGALALLADGGEGLVFPAASPKRACPIWRWRNC